MSEENFLTLLSKIGEWEDMDGYSLEEYLSMRNDLDRKIRAIEYAKKKLDERVRQLVDDKFPICGQYQVGKWEVQKIFHPAKKIEAYERREYTTYVYKERKESEDEWKERIRSELRSE